jgi:pyrroloquinoline-quinone synthase
MTTCPVCRTSSNGPDYATLARHFAERAAASDPEHVRWLNQTVSRSRVEASELETRLRGVFELGNQTLTRWVKTRFIERFYGKHPHPFVLALQHPSRETLLGYVIEHQHFLRQWVRSCGYILARTDQEAVVRYELDNLSTEFGGAGPDRPSHYELLLRMGEALGMPRQRTLEFPPLPATRRAIDEWDRIARESPWPAAMAAMHGLELIASRTLVNDGAQLHYFDPAILHGNAIDPAAQAFLREGYEADVGHSEEALRLVEVAAVTEDLRQAVQATFLRSVDLFDDYLMARLERGERLASPH